eukprot:1139895-Pelagomonas_calceolata.AAC.1
MAQKLNQGAYVIPMPELLMKGTQCTYHALVFSVCHTHGRALLGKEWRGLFDVAEVRRMSCRCRNACNVLKFATRPASVECYFAGARRMS